MSYVEMSFVVRTKLLAECLVPIRSEAFHPEYREKVFLRTAVSVLRHLSQKCRRRESDWRIRQNSLKDKVDLKMKGKRTHGSTHMMAACADNSNNRWSLR